ncbi:hypothetical protein AVEN_159985-1 [Araneus ventricosus]|uniref:SCAN box domain-containing protein n=1 Tax=Araneus ventricosus TaxID=182803 RepID=A0A4Y2SAE0_ARAVE|nr:hypothetical protein AVEN_159985-1 [Araneus ventricosus]
MHGDFFRHFSSRAPGLSLLTLLTKQGRLSGQYSPGNRPGYSGPLTPLEEAASAGQQHSEVKLLSEDRIEKQRKQKELDEKQKESDERESDRQFELYKLKLQQLSETVSLNSSGRERKIAPSLKNMMHKFDMETSDISLYMNLFDRPAKMADIEESECVNHLLALLPVKLAEQIIKLPEDNLADEFVKAKLLERLKLNAEAFSSKFINFQRPQGTLWKDVIFDLRTYLDGWLESLEVKDFKGLKELMVADQLKKRASPEMKDKFLDSWSKFCDPEALVEKFDDYESVRRIKKETLDTRIKLELPEIGVIDTKAAVLEKSIIMEHYLMGNQTQLIVDQKEAEPEEINVVVTRSQEAKLKSEPKNVEKEGKTIRAEVEAIDECQLPPPTTEVLMVCCV